MSSARVQTWVWWLLPLLVARALMPVGFMASVHDGRLQIVLCSGITQVLSDHDTRPGDADQNNAHEGQGDLPCPFAQATAAPLPQLNASEAIAFIPAAEILPPAESPYYAAGPPRFIATRGPPTNA